MNRSTVVVNLLIINALVFFLTNYVSSGLFHALALYSPESIYFRPWQVLTHMFVQDGMLHLMVNMFTLWMFGRQAEYDLGSRRFLVYYFVCGLGAAALQMGVNHFAGVSPDTAMVGASGAIYGILLAFGLMHANARVMLLIPPIPMKAKWMVIIFAALELFLGIRGGDGVAHFAHLGGILFGLLLLLYWKRSKKIYY